MTSQKRERIRKVGQILSESHEFEELQKTEGYQALESTRQYNAKKDKLDFEIKNLEEEQSRKTEGNDPERKERIEFLKKRVETLLHDTNTALYYSAITAFITKAFSRERIPNIMPTLKLPLKGDQPITAPFQYPVPMAAEVADSGALGIIPVAQVISGATAANPVVITATGHTLNDGDLIVIDEVVGMVELNGNTYKVNNAGTNTFELQNPYGTNIDGTGYTGYTSDGITTLNYGVGYEDITHSLYQGYPVRITHEIMQVQDVSLLAHEIAVTGDSLGRKFDSLKVAALRTATPSTELNRNYDALPIGTFINWDHITGKDGVCEKMFHEFNVLHTKATVLCTAEIYWRLLSDSSVPITQVEVKDSFGQPHIIQMRGDIQIIKSNHCAAKELFVIDTDKSGYAVHDEVKAQHFFPRTLILAHDIYGTNRMGAVVIQPMSVHRIMEDTA